MLERFVILAEHSTKPQLELHRHKASGGQNLKDLPPALTQKKQGVCLTMAWPFTLKSILWQKKNYENSNISPCKNIIFKIFSKRIQNPSTCYYNYITNLKFQHKPKYHLKKNPHIKIDLLLPRGQNPLSYYTL